MGVIHLLMRGMTLSHPKTAMFLNSVIGIIPSVLLAAPLFAAYVKMVLAIHDKKQPPPQVGDVFHGFSMLMQAGSYCLVGNIVSLVFVLLFVLLGCLGAILGYVGLIAFSVLTMFGIFFLVDKNLPVLDAYKASIAVVKQAFFPFLGLFILAGLIGAIGIIGCIIGVFATLPISFCIFAVAFRAITGGEASVSDTTPPTTLSSEVAS